VTVDGDPIPFVLLQQPNYELSVTGGRITLNADESFTDRLDVRENDAGTVTTDSEVGQGFYQLSGGALVLDYGGGSELTGAVSGTQITLIIEGFAFAFRK
jgi:hypothetical protein